MRLLAALALLTGCAGAPIYSASSSTPETVTVTWVRVSDVELQQRCRESMLGLAAPGMPMVAKACATFNLAARTCTIYTMTDFFQGEVGHEFMHCFLGPFHH